MDNKDQSLHKKHEKLTNTIYENPEMLPNRYVYILTNLCNLNCDFCYMERNFREDSMTTEDWNHLTFQLPEYARVTLTGGEPFMFKGFKEVFKNIAERFDCNVITNGTLLTHELSDFMLGFEKFRILSISVDDIKNRIRKINSELWENTEREIKYFLERRNQINPSCTFDIKTTILDETAERLFEIHKYCIEELGADFNVFHFLKGSPIQHSDKSFSFNDIFKDTGAQIYKKLDTIKEQFEKIRDYDIKNNKVSFLHPKVGSLTEKTPLKGLKLMNEKFHKKENFFYCKYPWSSMHINVNGNLFPCLAVPMGNVKTTPLKQIIQGEKMQKFRKIIREQGTIGACNRCGWLKPKIPE